MTSHANRRTSITITGILMGLLFLLVPLDTPAQTPGTVLEERDGPDVSASLEYARGFSEGSFGEGTQGILFDAGMRFGPIILGGEYQYSTVLGSSATESADLPNQIATGIEETIRVSNKLNRLMGTVRLSPWTGDVQPYAEAKAGVQIATFSITSSVSGSDFTESTSTGRSFAWGGAVGIKTYLVDLGGSSRIGLSTEVSVVDGGSTQMVQYRERYENQTIDPEELEVTETGETLRVVPSVGVSVRF
jgi:hypothetical protein